MAWYKVEGYGLLRLGPRTPTRATVLACCARTASGHAAAPPSSVMNSRAPSSHSFDHLVGGNEQRLRHGEAEGLGGLEIDRHLEFGRLQDRQFGWLGALEDAACINSCLAIGSGEACRIADQAACLDVIAQFVDRR